MRPLARRDGELIWPVFDQSPWSNVLIACSPSMLKQAEDLAASFQFNQDVIVIHMDNSKSPLECRSLVTSLLDGRSPYTGNANANTEYYNQYPKHIILIVHGIDPMLNGVRRASTREQVLNKFSLLLKTGPANGVHVVLIQEMNDKTARITSTLADLWGMVAIVGELTQVASAMLFPNSPLEQLWKHNQAVGFTSHNRKHNDRLNRRTATVRAGSMTGLVDIPR